MQFHIKVIKCASCICRLLWIKNLHLIVQVSCDCWGE